MGQCSALWHAYAGAAAFYAMRKYEEHCASEGKPQSHALAKELVAGIVAAEVGPALNAVTMYQSAASQHRIDCSG